jgi:Xaa-Pro aminopeptidase
VRNMKPERVCEPISNAELERRWTAIRALMKDRALDALVIQNSNDWLGGYVRWFTGVPANNSYPRSVVFPREGAMSMVCQGAFNSITDLDGNDELFPGVGRMLTTPSYAAVNYTADYDADLVIGEIKRAGYRSVGLVAPAAMYHTFGRRLAAALANAAVEVTDVTDWVDEIKAIKSLEEQGLIRRAAAMQDQVLASVREHIRPGLKDFEVAAYAQYMGQLLGSEQGIFIGSSAPEGRSPNFRPRWQQGRELCSGDTFVILLENNGPGGYYAELSRPIVLGKATRQQAETWQWLLEAQRQTVVQLRPGVACADVFAAHNSLLRSSGRPEEQRLYAHGQGYDMVERPLIRQDETMRFAAGMNLVVHPSVATSDLFLTVVDNYFIEADGPGECLHQTPKEIIEV